MEERNTIMCRVVGSGDTAKVPAGQKPDAGLTDIGGRYSRTSDVSLLHT